ncbi:MAG: ATP-binding protein, partial [Clostridiales bacterium]|nr:ATP-binding protein [Clostridiales bacterium]
YYGSKTKQCRCSAYEIRKYLDKISGPLLDRIDIQIEVDSVSVTEIHMTGKEESSLQVRDRVQQARKLQQNRYQQEKQFCNAQLTSSQIETYCPLDQKGQQLLEKAMERFSLSMRAYTRIIKVARTIADLAGEEQIQVTHVAEAVQYRNLDGKYWR